MDAEGAVLGCVKGYLCNPWTLCSSGIGIGGAGGDSSGSNSDGDGGEARRLEGP
jgi:hypothetical protein